MEPVGFLSLSPRFFKPQRKVRLVKYAGSGDSSDEARFRHFAATSLMMTNQIGVARTILANLPITRHSQDRGRPLLGYVPPSQSQSQLTPAASTTKTREPRRSCLAGSYNERPNPSVFMKIQPGDYSTQTQTPIKKTVRAHTQPDTTVNRQHLTAAEIDSRPSLSNHSNARYFQPFL